MCAAVVVAAAVVVIVVVVVVVFVYVLPRLVRALSCMCFVLALCSVAVRRGVLPTIYFAFASFLLLLLLCFALFVFALMLAVVYGYPQPAVNRQPPS